MPKAEPKIQDGMDATQEWGQVNSKKLERCVWKLQKRIYRASSRGDIKTVRRLQKTLLHSWNAKVIAIRRVSQDNQGKKTAGVDGVKSLSPEQRLALARQLRLTGKACPTRRVWIPKLGKDERRPLGIPVMYDRALQALVKLALEPEWEARFEPNSYGFRPGRSCHDAIEAIFNAIRYKAKYALDADIAKCFDRIDHKALLAKMATYPSLRRQVKAWLRSGVIDKGVFEETRQGTPQGGVISPLLANIALHGMEERVKQYAETLKGNKKHNRDSLSLIRYADDFVILHEDKGVVEMCREIIGDWLKGVGLELSTAKTRLTHTLLEKGFDFLGFTVRQFPVGNHQSGCNTRGRRLGFKTIISPSAQKAAQHYANVVSVVDRHKASPQSALIGRLNPVIKGWANYYSTVCSKEHYAALDSLVYSKLRRWANRRHPNKTEKWVARRYWRTIESKNWVFATREDKNPIRLRKYAETPIRRHVKVEGTRSPYDGNLVYWSKRMGYHPEVGTGEAKLLKKQGGRCTHCGLHFKPGDRWEIDHIVPKALGGKDSYDNLQLLHVHCHDLKTQTDGSLTALKRVKKRKKGDPLYEGGYLDSGWDPDLKIEGQGNGVSDKDSTTEEPDEVKVSRPVLKTSGSRKGNA